MRHRNLLLCAILGLGFLAPASTQATVLALGINLLYAYTGGLPTGLLSPPGTINTPLPQTSPGFYDLYPDATFRVQVTATLSDPNLSDGDHSPDGGDTFGAAGTPLGIQSLSADLNSTGPAGVLLPLAGVTPTMWGVSAGSNATPQTTPTRIAAPFVNLIDQGLDGDLDPSGIGYAQLFLGWFGNDTELPGIQNGIPSNNVAVYRGAYRTFLGFGTNQLTFANINGLAFTENAAADNSLAVEPFSSIVNPIVTIRVSFPEPASSCLLGPVLLGLFGFRRRRR